jgi:uncharacterized membrane-anchored protein YhcB (DUF1043 family)
MKTFKLKRKAWKYLPIIGLIIGLGIGLIIFNKPEIHLVRECLFYITV